MTDDALHAINAGDVDASGRDLLAKTTGLLDDLRQRVVTAKAVPMSASVMVSRKDTLARVDELRMLVGQAFAQAQDVLDQHERLIEDGRIQAAELVAQAKAEAAGLVSAEEVHRQATSAASRVVEGATRDAGAARAQVDDYVDRKLAHFEVMLTRTLTQVADGRRQLADPAMGAADEKAGALRALADGDAADTRSGANADGGARGTRF